VIPAGFIQDLLARTDIADVVGQHVELKRGGANLMGLCPFHGEKSPSFSVSPSKQFYYCFGCGASGDAIRFLSEHLGLSFVESVRELAGRVGMQVPEEQVSAEEQVRRDKLRERRLSIGEVLAKAAAFYAAQLKTSERAKEYLKGRGLTGAIAKRFGIGWAPPGWRALAGVFARYDDPLLEEAGLVRLRDDDGDAEERGRYDWFRERVMFPIRAVSGEVIGFGGRVLDDSKPKYMNSPETPVFSKGRELYGLYEARSALRDKGHALVVEGYMDVVALAQWGFPNAVATLGTACTAEHVQKLFRFTDAIVFSFDGDAAGRRAAGRALEAALPFATDLRSVRFLFLPPEHDPDSFVRELGAPAFEAALAQAVPLSRQLIEQAGEDCDLGSAEGRARMLAQAKPLWAALPDGALRRSLLGELARTAQLPLDELQAMWEGRRAPREIAAPAPRRAAMRRTAAWRTPAGSADLALRLLLRHSDWWDALSADDHHLLHALGGEHGALVGWLEQHLTEHGHVTWSTLQQAIEGHELAPFAARLVDTVTPDESNELNELHRVMHRLWVSRLETEAGDAAAAGDLPRLSALHKRIAHHKAEASVNPSL
jgi:DNA primase